MKNIKIKIFVNQLGNLKIKWKIPFQLLSDKGEIKIQLPSFKYDIPKVLGLPVPFSSKAFEIEINNIVSDSNKYIKSPELVDDFEGNKYLKLERTEITLPKNEDYIKLSYELKGIVNNDTIFFVIVYPIINTFPKDLVIDFEARARFSYKIRRFKLREWYFDRSNGKKVQKKSTLKTAKKGDLITVKSNNLILNRNEEFDFHLTGTRFLFMIRRDIFWLAIFIISLGLILSPIWSSFL
jgi:hypothetical protein